MQRSKHVLCIKETGRSTDAPARTRVRAASTRARAEPWKGLAGAQEAQRRPDCDNWSLSNVSEGHVGPKTPQGCKKKIHSVC